MHRTGIDSLRPYSIFTERWCIRYVQYGVSYSVKGSQNAIIINCAKSGSPQHALHLYQEMQKNESSPQVSGHTFVSLLKACGALKDLKSGLQIHSEVARTGDIRNPFIGSTLVDMYIKCGSLAKAQEAFDGLLVKDVVAWTTLMAGYARHGHTNGALLCFAKMQLNGASPDAHTFVCILKICNSTGVLENGEYLHAEIERRGILGENVFVASALVDLYAKCGSLGKAEEVFARCFYQNTIMWNALILGYAEHGDGDKAIEKYEQMQLNGISPNSVSYVFVLKTCGDIGAIDKGRGIHAEIERERLVETDSVVGNVLVDMYAQCGVLVVAQEVFDGLPMRDVVSWTALISGYVEHGQYPKAGECFDQMQFEGVSPSPATYVCILNAYGNGGATLKGRELHAKLEICGWFGRDTVVGNALVHMYAKCGVFSIAKQVFDKLVVRDVVSWTALIVGYVENGQGQKALELYDKMQCQGVFPNEVTFIYAVKACGSIQSIKKVDEVCAEVERRRLLDTDVSLGNALVDAYAKCDSLAKAHNVFYKLPTRDSVSYGVLIGGYVKHGDSEAAFKCFEEMHMEGIFPSAVTCACILKACGSLGAKERGSAIHVEIEKRGLLEGNLVVGNNLVDMYTKFGLLVSAQNVFNRLPVRDVVSWNALIGGYAWLGETEVVFSLLEYMQRECTKPDLVTFVIILSACSRIGLFSHNITHFEITSKDYGIFPLNSNHYVWIINVLGWLG